YVPGMSSVILNAPASSVIATCEPIVTVTPGSGSFVSASVITPCTAPVVIDCASTRETTNNRTKHQPKILIRLSVIDAIALRHGATIKTCHTLRATLAKMSQRLLALSEGITSCRSCKRLVRCCEAAAAAPPKRFVGQRYWARPISGFGDARARLLVV